MTWRLRTLGILGLALVSMAAQPQGVGSRSQGDGPGPRAGVGRSLPALGDNSDLTLAAERRIGDRIAASIYRDVDYLDDPVLADYVQSIWQPLMAAARAGGELSSELDDRFAWQLFLFRDRSINAFALPGGYVGVHLGLIGTASSPDELAAVLGHEMTHVTQRHISRLMTQQSRQAPWMIAAMVLGALAASKSPNAASAAIVGGQALATQNQLNFSRDMEREADRIGFGVMTDAGFEGRGVIGMFNKLQQASRLNDSGAFPYLRSHPLNTERIAEAQSRLQLNGGRAGLSVDLSAPDAADARLLHAMMASRARLLAAPGVDVQRAMLNDALGRASAPLTAPVPSPAKPDAQAASRSVVRVGTLYGGALAAAQMRDFEAAQTLLGSLSPLVTAHPRAALALELLATDIALMGGKAPPSTRTRDLSTLTNRSEVLTYSRALMAAGRTQEVSARLQAWVAQRPRDAAAWQLLSAAYTAQGRTVLAVRADAESRFSELDFPAALDRFKAAQGLMRSNPGSADHVEASILDTRARQTESIIREQALQDKVDR